MAAYERICSITEDRSTHAWITPSWNQEWDAFRHPSVSHVWDQREVTKEKIGRLLTLGSVARGHPRRGVDWQSAKLVNGTSHITNGCPPYRSTSKAAYSRADQRHRLGSTTMIHERIYFQPLIVQSMDTLGITLLHARFACRRSGFDPRTGQIMF